MNHGDKEPRSSGTSSTLQHPSGGASAASERPISGRASAGWLGTRRGYVLLAAVAGVFAAVAAATALPLGGAGAVGFVTTVARDMPDDCVQLQAVRSPAFVLDLVEPALSELDDELYNYLWYNAADGAFAGIDGWHLYEGGRFDRRVLREEVGIDLDAPMAQCLRFVTVAEEGRGSSLATMMSFGAAGEGSLEAFVAFFQVVLGDDAAFERTDVEGATVFQRITPLDDVSRSVVYVWQRRGRLLLANVYDRDRSDRWVSEEAIERWVGIEEAESFAAREGFVQAMRQDITADMVHVNLLDDAMRDGVRHQLEFADDITFYWASLGVSDHGVTADLSMGFDEEEHRVLRVFPESTVDVDTLSRAPGPAVAAIGGHVDLAALIDAVHSEVRAVEPADIDGLSDQLNGALGVALEDLVEMLDGEVGVMLHGDVEDALEAARDGRSASVVQQGVAESVLVYLTVEDRDEVANLLNQLADRYANAGLALEDEGSGVMLSMDDVAIGLDEQALWFGSQSLVEGVLAQGEAADPSEPLALASAMPTRAAVAATLDLARLVAPWTDLLGDQYQLELDPAEVLELLTLSVSRDAGALRIQAQTRFDSDAFVASGLPAAAGQELAAAMQEYERRLRTVEANTNLILLHDASAEHFTRQSAEAGALEARFPASVPLTPSQIPCGQSALPSNADWAESSTWIALDFALTDPHYYAYQYDSRGAGSSAQFTASAFGDLDCDGVASTFVRFGKVEDMEVVGSRGLYVVGETE